MESKLHDLLGRITSTLGSLPWGHPPQGLRSQAFCLWWPLGRRYEIESESKYF
jgi:hypothetical protein